MSRFNSREEKAKRRTIRKLTKGTGDTYINLVEYLKLRTRCTTGMAERILMSEAIMVDSHPVGFHRLPTGQKVLQPLVPAKFRDRIVVGEPKVAA